MCPEPAAALQPSWPTADCADVANAVRVHSSFIHSSVHDSRSDAHSHSCTCTYLIAAHCTAPYRTVSYHIASHRTASHGAASLLISSHHIAPHRTASHSMGRPPRPSSSKRHTSSSRLSTVADATGRPARPIAPSATADAAFIATRDLAAWMTKHRHGGSVLLAPALSESPCAAASACGLHLTAHRNLPCTAMPSTHARKLKTMQRWARFPFGHCFLAAVFLQFHGPKFSAVVDAPRGTPRGISSVPQGWPREGPLSLWFARPRAHHGPGPSLRSTVRESTGKLRACAERTQNINQRSVPVGEAHYFPFAMEELSTGRVVEVPREGWCW